MNNVCYLIDLSNFLYKYKNTQQVSRIINGCSVNCSSAVGIIHSLKAIPYKDIFVAVDGYPLLFMQYYPGYKGQRSREPNECLYFPKRDLMQIIYGLGKRLKKNIHIIASPGQEADQVISSAALMSRGLVSPIAEKLSINQFTLDQDRVLKKLTEYCHLKTAEEVGINFRFESTIVGTTDSDMFQLCTHGVYIDSTVSGTELNEGTVTPASVHNLPPSCIPAYKALKGDVGDNIPEVPGIPKLSVLLGFIQRYLCTAEKLNSFIKACQAGGTLPRTLGVLRESIMSAKGLSQLKLNAKLTAMQFYSVPMVLVPNEDNFDEIVNKYQLSI